MNSSTLQNWVGAWKELQQWLLHLSAGQPSGARKGAFWYDTDANEPRWHDGANVRKFGVTDHSQLEGLDSGDPHPQYILGTEIGVTVPPLEGGIVPSQYLPAYVDDVIERDSLAAFPVVGETGKIYVAKDTNRTYRWSGSGYVEISASLALGETSVTAYRGDRGAQAYAHSQQTGNPHGTAVADISGLQGALDGKSPLNTTLADNAESSTPMTTASGSLVSKLQQARDYMKYLLSQIGTKANAIHGHAVGDVTNLQTTLDGKQPKIIVGTVATAAATAAKDCLISGYTLAAGDILQITFTLGNSVSTPTLNVNGAGAKKIRIAGVDANTTAMGLASGAVVLLQYDGTYFNLFGSQRVTDTDTYNRMLYEGSVLAGENIFRYKILAQGVDGKYYQLTTGDNTQTGNAASTTKFLFGSPIVWSTNGATVTSGGTLGNLYSCLTYNTLQHNFNTATRTAYLPLYLVATDNMDGTWSVHSSMVTQTLPTTDDGLLYIYLGFMTNTNTTLRLMDIHPIYWYKDGKVRPYSVATKLATSRTISLTGDVTGSASFDGSANVSINAAVAGNSHNHTNYNITDAPVVSNASGYGQYALRASTGLNGYQGLNVYGANQIALVSHESDDYFGIHCNSESKWLLHRDPAGDVSTGYKSLRTPTDWRGRCWDLGWTGGSHWTRAVTVNTNGFAYGGGWLKLTIKCRYKTQDIYVQFETTGTGAVSVQEAYTDGIGPHRAVETRYYASGNNLNIYVYMLNDDYGYVAAVDAPYWCTITGAEVSGESPPGGTSAMLNKSIYNALQADLWDGKHCVVTTYAGKSSNASTLYFCTS